MYLFVRVCFITVFGFRESISGANEKDVLVPVQIRFKNMQVIENIEIPIQFSNGKQTFTFLCKADSNTCDISLPPGIYNVHLRHIQFEPITIEEFQVLPGRENVIRIPLKLRSIELTEVTIPDTSWLWRAPIRESYIFTVEQTQRFAASFYDPARMATAFPGVATGSDEGNHLSIRGNSPQATTWRIQGADIVNPNHLANGGTFSDRISMSGGGVSILSAQILGSSALYTAGYPVSYGNALGGFFDLSLRQGSLTQKRYTLQASIIGLDACIEGPTTKKKSGSYLANYRYSTTGLLALLGIDFGGQVFGFQDVSMHIVQDAKRLGKVGFFGLGGYSLNQFSPSKDVRQWSSSTDRTVLDFSQYMGATGVTHEKKLHPKWQLNQVLAISAHSSDNYFGQKDSSYTTLDKDRDLYKYGKAVWHSRVEHFVSRKLFGVLGNDLQYHFFTLKSETHQPIGSVPILLLHTHNTGWLWQPYLSAHAQVSHRWEIAGGLRFVWFDKHPKPALDPYAHLRYILSTKWATKIQYRLASQIQPLGAYSYLADDQTEVKNKLEFSRSHQLGWLWQYQVRNDLICTLEPYIQYLFHIPISREDNRGDFSMLNVADGFTTFPLQNSGIGYNGGIECLLRKSFSNQWYGMASLTLFDSKYKGADGLWRETRFNRRFLSHVAGGKEWNWHRGTKKRFISADMRIYYNGGLRDMPIDIDASVVAGRTVYATHQGYSKILPNYFRIDTRLSIRKIKTSYNRILALEFQNLTNHPNIAFYFYDNYTKSEGVKYQLGIIPNVSYRVEF